MKSEWKVLNNGFFYQVYRLMDNSSTNHCGNHEYATGTYDNRDEAVRAAIALNKGVR